MSEQSSRYQALAASGAAIVAFVGVCHEVVGPQLFPWGPAFFGGVVPWHAVGVLCIATGSALLCGVLRLFWFPVVAVSVILVVVGIGAAVISQVAHGQFHMFAVALAVSGVVTAVCYREALRG